MKEVRAFVKPHKLSDVTLALRKIQGLTGTTVTDSRGFGRGRAQHNSTADEPSGYSPTATLVGPALPFTNVFVPWPHASESKKRWMRWLLKSTT